jgi:1,2-diacylglycerol 3-alpha-glucosyltransferase
MRIGVAASGLSHIKRGVEAWAAYMGKALYERGEFVRLYKGSGEEKYPYERVVPCWQQSHRKARFLLRYLPKRFFWRLGLHSGVAIEQTTFALKLLRHLRRDKIDILHVKDPPVALMVQRAAALGLVPCRTVFSHGTDEPLEFLRKIDYLQHLAPWHLEDVRARGAWKPAWTAIPNFIDTDTFHPSPSGGRGDGGEGELRKELNLPPDALVVLTAAAIKKHHKRTDYLLEEFAAFLRSVGWVKSSEPTIASPAASAPGGGLRRLHPPYLVVAGAREKDTDELIERGRQLLGDRVRFLVNYPLDKMPALYRLADLFVLCTLKEMLGTVLLEAMATEVPCVVHHFPVTEWVVGPGGLVIDMERPGALAEALETLVSDDTRRKDLGQKARHHCVEHFSRDVVIDQYLDYYRFVLAQPGRNGHQAKICSTPEPQRISETVGT